MLPPFTREKTSGNRIVLAVVFAFGFPALGLSQDRRGHLLRHARRYGGFRRDCHPAVRSGAGLALRAERLLRQGVPAPVRAALSPGGRPL